MPKSGRMRVKIFFFIKSVLTGSVVMSRTFAAPAPIAPDHIGMVEGWRELGEQMHQTPSALPPLDDALIDLIESADLQTGLTEVVYATYDMVDPSDVQALDAYWASVLTAAGSASLVAEFLNLRSTLDLNSDIQTEADDLVWLAAGNGQGNVDGCDNGWGNGDNGSPGGSGPKNNGENFEGGGQDGTKGGNVSNSSGNKPRR